MDKFPKGRKNDPIWWGIIAVMYCTGVFWWLALILTFMNINGSLPPLKNLLDGLNQKVNQKAPQVAEAMGAGARQVRESVRTAQSKAEQKAEEKAKRKTRRSVGKGIAQTVWGWILSVTGGMALSFGTIDLFFDRANFDPDMLAAGLPFVLAGVILLLIGKRKRDKNRRYETLEQMLGEQPDLSVQAIADMAGQTVKVTEDDLADMIDRGYFPEGTWLDRANGRLRSKPYAEPGPEPSQAEKVLRQIRLDNDLIDDPEISRKIDEIESLTRKIFAFQELHPERAGQLRSFMNYYLPQTLKLMEAYARLEAQGADTPTAKDTKQRISAALDLLATGYSRQLDKLLTSDAVDITADIKVMEAMMARDGLTEDLHL